ncbi:LptA/OstA family protein, partial [Synechococcus sp. OH2]|uniref:LptA/OstA family protein n=1 Tax=Synechococcus sp. OH2 TaxID=136798 RepID=UPI0039C25379
MKGFWWLWLCLGVFGLATAAPASAQKSRVAAAPPGDTTDALAERTLRLRSDRQTFDQRAQVFLAEGNVEMRLGRSVLRADRLRIELQQRRAVAEGNVSIELDQQRIQGSRLEYDFGREQGFLEEAFGQVDIGQLQA